MKTTVIYVHSSDPTEFGLRVDHLVAQDYQIKRYRVRIRPNNVVFCHAVLVRSAWRSFVYAIHCLGDQSGRTNGVSSATAPRGEEAA